MTTCMEHGKEIFKRFSFFYAFWKKENIFTNFLVNLKYISDIWGYVKETALYMWVFSSLDAPILYLLIDMVPSFLCVEGRCASCSLMNKVIRCSWMLDVIRNSPDFSLTGFLTMTRAAECHGVLALMEVVMLFKKKVWARWVCGFLLLLIWYQCWSQPRNSCQILMWNETKGKQKLICKTGWFGYCLKINSTL